ncbi:glycosyltransferase family 2 protein [Neobacillus niacini]|uniref:glycosyltransferase family 2 protein n=1 Tax=Neobacillus niacini TaxID=86668 RepID=UPI001C8DEBBC|nr:glycosyltransferase family 2 protein [Neobacillus niacini]MBY0145119.1 glycosyltransferase [Neobacillus niacini]
MDLVSVVIPTYARNDMLKRAIDSVLNQTYSNIEILVIDDNSNGSDHRRETEIMMSQYELNNKVRYIKNPENMGGARARNVGIKHAGGKFVAFLDDDDEYFPENIQEKLSVFKKSKNSKLALVYGYTETVTDSGKRIIVKHNFSGNCLYEQLVHNCIAATSQWMCRKDVLLEVGMFQDVPCKQDSILMLNILKNDFEIDCVSKVLTRYYDYEGLRISNKGKTILGEINYRNLGREVYGKFSTNQIREIEYSFANRLMILYLKKKEYKSAAKELVMMCKIHLLKTIKVVVNTFINLIVGKISKKSFVRRG